MKNSDIMKMFAQANRDCGYDKYADMIDKSATVKEAEEITEEAENG